MNKDIIHLKAPGNWINDPNGFIYYKGNYHLFYQYFPYAPSWGTMHWGHAVSKDLVSWEHLGVALFPTKYEDQNGCFSGSAVEHDGKMYLYYTGVHYNKPDPNNIHMCLDEQFDSAQMMIASENGFTFDNFEDKAVIIPPLSDQKIGDRTHTRDPKVWRGKDAWYMVLGSKDETGNGKLIFYKSSNLKDWMFVNSASKGNGFGCMWECPDYFETEGGEVLMISPMGLVNDGKRYVEQSICMPVKFNESDCSIDIPDRYQYLDYGQDLYAPQSTVDEEGKRVVIAWMRMPEAVGGKWSGMFCIPRIVEVKNGHIYFRAHPHVTEKFTHQAEDVTELNRSMYRVSGDVEDGGTLDIGGYRISRKGKKIYADRSSVFEGFGDYRMQFDTPEVKDGYHLDVYVDENLIEIFVNNGEYVISNIVYGLKQEIHADHMENLQIFAME